MKKQVALAVAAALSLSVAGTALAAPANPFVDVPANHWAYDALTALQKDGVVTGYGDGTFRGDRNLTRYEMAAMIAKITVVDDKNGPLIKRLQSEFATELYNLGVRVDKLEKGASTIKFTGDARIRYQRGYKGTLDSVNGDSSRFQNRVRINATADINENTKFVGRMKWESNNNDTIGNGAYRNSDTRNVYFDRAEFIYTKGNWGLNAGRMLPVIGQALLTSDVRADGVMAKYNPGKWNIAVGYLDVTTGIDSNRLVGQMGSILNEGERSVNAFVAHLGYNFSDRAALTAGYLQTNKNSANFTDYTGTDKALGTEYQGWSVGGNVKLGKDLKLTAEYVKNEDAKDEDDGYFARLAWKNRDMKKPGSYSLYGEYMDVKDNSIIGTADYFDIAPKNRKGFGFGFDYTLAKNVALELNYHWLENAKTGKDREDYFTIATNFAF